MQTSWGEKDGTYTVSSNSAGHDFERFAEALTVQGYAPELTTAGDEVTLRVNGSPSAAPPRPCRWYSPPRNRPTTRPPASTGPRKRSG